MRKCIRVISISVLLCFLGYYFLYMQNSSSEAMLYSWPAAESLPSEITYTGEGEIKYIEQKETYADASGIYEDVNYWTIYINHATLSDVKAYISELKKYGVQYVSFDDSAEPAVEYVWPGYVFWWGQAEDCAVKVYLEEQELFFGMDDRKDGVKEDFHYNLIIEIIDEKIWNC